MRGKWTKRSNKNKLETQRIRHVDVEGTYREQHVLLVLVDSPHVGNGISVFDHTDGLT